MIVSMTKHGILVYITTDFNQIGEFALSSSLLLGGLILKSAIKYNLITRRVFRKHISTTHIEVITSLVQELPKLEA
jgi:hypothetical protein